MNSFGRLFSPKRLVRPLWLATAFAFGSMWLSRKDFCCGIIGVITTSNNAEIVVKEGVSLLQNRGYDSAGIVTFTRGDVTQSPEPHLTKYGKEDVKGDCVEMVCRQTELNHKGSYMGIGHTRWATCGSKTSPNAHPHFDETHNYYLVHNGTIVNYKELRDTYLKDKHFTSQTDTEVIVQLLAKLCEEEKLTLAEGLRKLQDYLIGQWGLVAMSRKQPDEICVSTYGSPILVGFGSNGIYVASQSIAFEKYTKDYMETRNDEIFTLSLSTMEALKQQMTNQHRMLKITKEVKVKLQPDQPYTSFYEEEIYEQGQLHFKPYLHELDGVTFHDNLTLLACGSSLYASLYSLFFLKTLHAFKKVVALDAAELLPEDIQQNESIIFVSQSGQTKDLLNAEELAKKVPGVKTIGVINVVGSALARKVDCPVYTNVGREVAVGATKSFSHQILNLLAIALKIAEQKGFAACSKALDLKADLQHIMESFRLTATCVREKCKEVANVLKSKQSLYLLAKSEALAIAKEGALKIKELCYIHAEAFGASEMKHGPLALVNSEKPKETVVIFLILDDKNLPAMKVAIDELHSRRAYIVVITDCQDKLNRQKVDHFVQVPKLRALSSLLCLIPLQLIANQICVANGINPDKPRNLAKTVTV